RQSRHAKGTPEPALLARAFGAGFAVAVVGGVVLLVTPFLGLLLAGGLGLRVAARPRGAPRRRVHTQLGVAAAAAAVLGLAGVALVLGANPLNPRLLLAYLIAGGIGFPRGAGGWG